MSQAGNNLKSKEEASIFGPSDSRFSHTKSPPWSQQRQPRCNQSPLTTVRK